MKAVLIIRTAVTITCQKHDEHSMRSSRSSQGNVHECLNSRLIEMKCGCSSDRNTGACVNSSHTLVLASLTIKHKPQNPPNPQTLNIPKHPKTVNNNFTCGQVSSSGRAARNRADDGDIVLGFRVRGKGV